MRLDSIKFIEKVCNEILQFNDNLIVLGNVKNDLETVEDILLFKNTLKANDNWIKAVGTKVAKLLFINMKIPNGVMCFEQYLQEIVNLKARKQREQKEFEQSRC